MTDRTSEQTGAEANQTAAETPGTTGAESAQPQPESAGGEGGAKTDSGPQAPDASAELQALKDRYLRLAAEYENYRKRTEKERAESWTRAQAQLVQQLLDPLDDLQRVAHFNADTTTVQALLDGVQMVERKMLRVLEAAGLEVVDATGRPFDPLVHEALLTGPAETHEDDESVGEVFQKGYRFKGDLLRPARVQVRKYGG